MPLITYSTLWKIRKAREICLYYQTALVVVLVFLCALVIFTCSARRSPVASIASKGVFDCFPATLSSINGKQLVCEASAVMSIDDRTLLVATDKDIPNSGYSQVFELPFFKSPSGSIQYGRASYRTARAFRDVRKVEALAKGKHLRFAMSDFDWPPEPNSTEADPYNTFLFWNHNTPHEVHVAYRVERDGVVSSLPLRKQFAKALANEKYPDGPPYFKIEGLSALPGNRLVFGVREVGESYEDFEFKVIMLATNYKVGKDGLVFVKPITKLLDFSTELVTEAIGLSSLHYDWQKDRLYFLTSVESNGEFGGYLWTISSVAHSDEFGSPILLRDKKGSPLRFQHKPEGLTSIDKNSLLVVHDDDRELTAVKTKQGVVTRQLHQSAYTVVNVR